MVSGARAGVRLISLINRQELTVSQFSPSVCYSVTSSSESSSDVFHFARRPPLHCERGSPYFVPFTDPPARDSRRSRFTYFSPGGCTGSPTRARSPSLLVHVLSPPWVGSTPLQLLIMWLICNSELVRHVHLGSARHVILGLPRAETNGHHMARVERRYRPHHHAGAIFHLTKGKSRVLCVFTPANTHANPTSEER
jgi:hypothetical protein